MSEWFHCTLADACSAINYGFTASASNYSIGPRFLRITDIVSGQLDWNVVPFVAVDDETFEKYRLHDKDIVIARTGASTGVSAYIKNPPPAVFASYLVRLKTKPEFDSRFLSYYLKSHEFWDFIRGVLGDTSAQPNASASTMAAAPLSAPSCMAEQRSIAHILGMLDDKIELNQHMNETLEEIARAMFKSWFVDFDPVRAKVEGRDTGLPKHIVSLFPDQIVESEFGEIPKGWKIMNLVETFDLKMGQSPPGDTYNEHGEGLPFFQGRTDFGFRFPRNRKFCTAPARIALPGDTLVSVRAPVGDINMALDQSCIGRGVAALRHKSGLASFTYYSAGAIQEQLRQYEHTGTVFGAITKKQFETLSVLEPSSEIVKAFDDYVSALDLRIKNSTSNTYFLASLRDTLLPELLSGRMRVKKQKTYQN